MKINNIGNGDGREILLLTNFFLKLMKNKQHIKSLKSQLLGRPAGPIFYVFIAKKSLIYRSEIALSALHLVESDTTTK